MRVLQILSVIQCVKMSRPQDRPQRADRDEIIKKVMVRKNIILLPNKKIITKSNKIWAEIASELKNTSASAVYMMVYNNTYGIRDKLSENVSVTNLSVIYF